MAARTKKSFLRTALPIILGLIILGILVVGSSLAVRQRYEIRGKAAGLSCQQECRVQGRVVELVPLGVAQWA